MSKAPIDLLDAPVEVSILRDGKPLMKQTFQHTPIRFGRILDNDIVLPFDSVSRHHCELRYHGGQWALIDLKSMNGVRVNGERVTSASFEGQGEFELKPVIIQIKALRAQTQPAA
ncbi:MAG: FHA domain-containing protein, partial [Bdellovibrionales bacterium]|nr:FHA domain-containing protein [Bdellovibrionales bacterium]